MKNKITLNIKDWFEKTVEYTSQDKGVYIELLFLQAMNGSIPNDEKALSRLCRMDFNDFIHTWSRIKANFIKIEEDRLVEQCLYKEQSKKENISSKNKIIGTFGQLLQDAVKKNPDFKKMTNVIKKSFKVDDFSEMVGERLSERLSEWIGERLIECQNKEKKGVGKEPKEIPDNSLFVKSKNHFFGYYKEVTGLGYQFNGMDGNHLKELLKKIKNSLLSANAPDDDDSIFDTFVLILQKLPDFHKNKITIPLLNSQYNSIILQIKSAPKKSNLAGVNEYLNNIDNGAGK